jgi:hypothetical protein
VKVLAAVSAPTQTKAPNRAQDIEAEMQAVLDATSAALANLLTGAVGEDGGFVRGEDVQGVGRPRRAVSGGALVCKVMAWWSV